MSDAATYRFRALRPDGTLETGHLRAPTREGAASLLTGRGLFPVELAAGVSTGGGATVRVGAQDLAIGLRTLADLLDAGLPLSRALALLEDLAPPAWRPALPDVRRRVEEGDHLSAALGASGLPLPPHAIGIISAGDAGSGLARAVGSAAGLLEARAATRTALREALAYPAMLAVAGSLSVALLVGVVLPRFAELLSDAGQSLPTTTRLVMGAATLARPGFLVLLLGGPILLLSWRAWVRSDDGATTWHRLLLRLPLLGGVRRSWGTASGCAALSALLRAGMPLAAALPHAGRATGDRAQELALVAGRIRVVQGSSLARALELEGALTPTAVRFVRIGEETGDLAGMLASAAEMESRHALQRVQGLIRLIEPAMVVAFGVVVMIVAAALLQAMYGLRPAP